MQEADLGKHFPGYYYEPSSILEIFSNYSGCKEECPPATIRCRLFHERRRTLTGCFTKTAGRHRNHSLLAKMKVIYKTSMDEMTGDLPEDYYSDYYTRPRKRLGSAPRLLS